MNRKKISYFIGVLILLNISVMQIIDGLSEFGALAAESELTLDQILDRVEKHYAGKSFQAEFVQESTIKAMDIVDFASGKIFVRYPGMMRWEYEKPEKQAIISDGHKLWIYRPSDNQVLTGSAPAFFSDGKGASFLSDIKLIRQKFRISLDNSKEDFFYELKLLPLEKKLDVTVVRLAVTKNTFTVIRITTYNSYGDENRIEFVNHQFEVKLNDSLFSFKIPPGAEVLQLDE